MLRPRALLATGAGLGALTCSVVAIAADNRWLVLVAAVLAVAAFVAIASWPQRLFAGRRRQANLEAEAEHLAKENDVALARAARFEAEAVRARAELAEAMRSEQLLAGNDADALGSGAGRRANPVASPHDVIVDPETGLFSQLFFEASLAKRISAARRGLRPLSVGVAEVVLGVTEPPAMPAPSRPVGEVMLQVFREADTVARSDDGRYLILLEDTPENGAIWTLERLRRRIAEELPGHTLRVGLSCYPAYAFDADQLTTQAADALESAREWQQDRIEVTTASPD
ncbi:MAG: diguanylate cyclase protein [Acidimicrobiales bacterium]|nr:diguanylate cyclase protein [Acidimicrobiales bacterium]